MNKRDSICERWSTDEITSFVGAISEANEICWDFEQSWGIKKSRPKPTRTLPKFIIPADGTYIVKEPKRKAPAKALLEADAKKARQMVMEIFSREPLWEKLQKDANFRSLYKAIRPKLDPIRPMEEVILFEALVAGISTARRSTDDVKDPNKKVRDKAARLARQLLATRREGIRVGILLSEHEFWSSLSEFVEEMAQQGRKKRNDARRGVRDALDQFIGVLLSEIPSANVTASVVCAFAAMLGDTAEREVERQLSAAKKRFKEFGRLETF